MIKLISALSFFIIHLSVFSAEIDADIVNFCNYSIMVNDINESMAKCPGYNAMNSNQKLDAVKQLYGEGDEFHQFSFVMNVIEPLKESIISRGLVQEVPLHFRHHFPQSEIIFQALDPIIDFENKILVIGGDVKECKLLEFNGIQQDMLCVTNVVPSAKPNYIADATNEKHMELFFEKFNCSFARAVPFSSREKLESGLENIARSLTKNGIFMGRLLVPTDITPPEFIEKLKEAKFKSYRILKCSPGIICFLATHLPVGEGFTMISNDTINDLFSANLIYDFLYRYMTSENMESLMPVYQ